VFLVSGEDVETSCCPDVSGELLPPIRSQDSNQSGFRRLTCVLTLNSSIINQQPMKITKHSVVLFSPQSLPPQCVAVSRCDLNCPTGTITRGHSFSKSRRVGLLPRKHIFVFYPPLVTGDRRSCGSAASPQGFVGRNRRQAAAAAGHPFHDLALLD